MRHQVLIVDTQLQRAALPPDYSGKFDLVTAANGKEGLERLALSNNWSAVLVATDLGDMSGMAFLSQAVTLSQAVPLMLAPDNQVLETLNFANSRSIFRVVPESTPGNTLAKILLDAAHQHTLIHQEENLWERMSKLTLIDPLTGCFSRLHLEDHLKKELTRSLRYGHHLSVILCDIDGLKGVNESFGHKIGDQVLTTFAQIALQHVRRDIDTITRWGEDEFLLVLPETQIRGAGRVANRLREQFTQSVCFQEGHQVNSTASFGVAGFVPEHSSRNADVDDLLLIASRCLMQAKAAGGNQVLCCP
ncbi:MAG: GGDEF domain-containing protein [Desulfobulbus sp.]|nr:GGDEF domain-containing protein [Desulfobulbus sp.]